MHLQLYQNLALKYIKYYPKLAPEIDLRYIKIYL